MKLYYFGYYCDNVLFSKINNEDAFKLSQARQNFEELILKGLIENLSDVEIYSYIPTKNSKHIANYSHLENKKIKLFKVNKNNPFSSIISTLKLFFLIAKLPKKSPIVMYSVNPLFIVPLIIMRPFKKFTITTICSELPQFRRGKGNFFTRSKHVIQAFYNKRFNKYILITDSMKDIIPIKNKPYIVVEGMAPSQVNSPKVSRNNTVMYAGALTSDNLIIQLIEACLLSVKTEKIIIFGEGPEEEKIKRMAKINEKIIFLGYQNRDKILEHEKTAGLLASLRDFDNPISKYAFPSKIMEYLSSGTLVLSTKIDGIPKEYYNFIECIEDKKAELIAEKIDAILSLDDATYYKRSVEQQDFIQKKKNYVIQTNKMIEFINSQRT